MYAFSAPTGVLATDEPDDDDDVWQVCGRVHDPFVGWRLSLRRSDQRGGCQYLRSGPPVYLWGHILRRVGRMRRRHAAFCALVAAMFIVPELAELDDVAPPRRAIRVRPSPRMLPIAAHAPPNRSCPAFIAGSRAA
jgi:hypothetical protein